MNLKERDSTGLFIKIFQNTKMCMQIKNLDFFSVKVTYIVIKLKVIRSRIEKFLGQQHVENGPYEFS